MAKLTRAEMDAFKKKNFNLKVKVTKAQLDKLRAAGTPAAAIAKYKNDPAMREALNRFYGKAKITAAAGSASSPVSSTATKVPTRGGPGAKVRPRPPGGPGAKLTSKTSGKSVVKPDARPVGTYKVKNPIKLSNPFGNAQAKLDTKAAATKILLEKNKKAREEKSKKKGK